MKIENFGKLSEYVENQNEVLEILKKFDFDIEYNCIKEIRGVNAYNYTFIIKNLETGIECGFDYSERYG